MSTTYTYPTSYKFGNVAIGGAGSGGTYATTGATSYTWGTTNTKTLSTGQVIIAGDAVFEGNITWQDRDMREWFESVESRLAMLQPNTKLEAEYEELAELGRQYKELEKRLLEKQRVFDILKNPVD